MGAHRFEDSASKKAFKTAKEAYTALCENAEWGTCGFFMCSPPKDDKEYDDILMNKCEKWEGCACYETDDEWVFFGWAAS